MLQFLFSETVQTWHALFCWNKHPVKYYIYKNIADFRVRYTDVHNQANTQDMLSEVGKGISGISFSNVWLLSQGEPLGIGPVCTAADSCRISLFLLLFF